jgi:SAM-dependent methyltransferase
MSENDPAAVAAMGAPEGTGGANDPEPPDRVTTIRRLWTDGDYARIGQLFEPISVGLVDELDADERLLGREVLDAATGTGNTALALAARGAKVHAFDLTPRLLDIARLRAEDAGVDVELVEGDLVDVPYPDGRFDLVVSTFGAFTADDHARCAAELIRVCRPGGQVISTAWTDHGCLATLRTTVLDAHPGLVDPAHPDPADWTRLDALYAMVDGLPVEVQLDHRTHPFRFDSASAAMQLMEQASGPVQRLRDGVHADGGDWDALRERIVERWEAEGEQVPDGIVLRGVYGVARFRLHR